MEERKIESGGQEMEEDNTELNSNLSNGRWKEETDGRRQDRDSNLSNGPILCARSPVIPQITQLPVKIPIFDF